MLCLPPWVKEKREQLLRYLERWGIDTEKIQDFELFLCAFVHKSYASDFKEPYLHNERLEFVGDAALGAVIAKALFLNFPWMQESTMTLYKIALVREETLAEVAQKIWLNQQIFISKGEEKNNNNWVINSSESKKDSTIFSVINLINKYLWRSFGVIAMGLTAYAGYEAINSWGDTKSLKKAMRIFIGIAVGLAIAMLSSALIKIVVNLI